MQAGSVFLSQCDSLGRRGQTSLLATDERMEADIRVVAMSLLSHRHIVVDDIRILAVSHNGQRCRGKNLIESLITIHKHITRTTTHEEFDARHTVRVELAEEAGIVVGGTKEEGVVHMTAMGCPLELVFQGFQGGGLRHGIGHLEIRCHTTSSGSTALTLNVGLLRHPWLAEMHVGINDTWENIAARGIYFLVDGEGWMVKGDG